VLVEAAHKNYLESIPSGLSHRVQFTATLTKVGISPNGASLNISVAYVQAYVVHII
jgi:hypothetical protein